jgi:uncharacterized protein GlcG (DUF336 family)
LKKPSKLLRQPLKKAEEISTQMCIAVVDSGASLKAFARMDDAWVGSIDIAIKRRRLPVSSECPRARSANSLSLLVRCLGLNIPMKG